MSEVSATRSSFFLKNSSTKSKQAQALRRKALQRNQSSRATEIKNKTEKDAKVAIPDAIKDFSRIKRAVDAAPPIDNSKKIADLKARIKSGDYKIDYDALADKMLKSEF